MLSYIRIGANDIAASGRFYAAILPPLGYIQTDVPNGIEFTYPDGPGQPATAGNGSMTAFEADSQAMVRTLHTAGLKAGGSDEGAPGHRAAYGKNFYVAYLRDPVGNKLAIFSTTPAEPARAR